MTKLLSRYHLILLVFVFILAFILRFNNLDKIPNGLYQDETAIGYNAYSILTTGKDEYGKSYPVYFKSFGDQKLPIYIYATTISEKLFGVNAFSVRFPSAFFGFLTVVVFYFFIKLLTKDKVIAFVSTTLLSINPWSLDYNRATFEVSICMFLFVAGGYLLLKAFDSKRFGYFLGATILFILCLYSYNLTRLLSPLLFVLFLFFHRKQFKNISKPELALTTIVSLLLLLPFGLSIFASGGASSASGTFLFSSNAVKAPLIEFRSYFIYHDLFAKLFFNTWVLLGWQYVNNIVSYFSTPFLFVAGSNHGNHGIGNVGQMYLFEFPLIIMGVAIALKQKLQGSKLLILWGVITILVASLTRDIPQATRSIFLIVPLEVFSSIGLVYFYKYVKTINPVFLKSTVSVIVTGVFLYSILFYFSSYYVRFPIYYAKQWRQQDQELVKYLVTQEKNYDHIIFDSKSGFIYSSYLFYSLYSPQEFQDSAKRLPDDTEGFSKVISFGKFEFRDINWQTDINTPKTLIITTNNFRPKELSVEKSFNYPVRPVVQSVGEVISIFPVTDNAYEVVKAK